MTITIRIPRPLLYFVGAVLAVAVGAGLATLLPTPLMGYLGGKPVHEPTSLSMYTPMGVICLTVYTAAIGVVRRRT